MPQDTNNTKNGTHRKRKPSSLVLDKRTRGLLSRFLSDWVRPRWRALGVALLLDGAIWRLPPPAIPKIIQISFDTASERQNKRILIHVLLAIIAITALRSTLLYLQTVMTNRIVTRA